jgi:uncharacterized membrane protein
MNRFVAACLHFGICVSIALVLLGLFWIVWYPSPLFLAIGGHEMFLILVAVDIVVGPLLTLIVYRPAKPSLRFDLCVIAGIQVIALVYGIATLLQGRPVYIAALGHRFDAIQASEIDDSELSKSIKTLPWFGPEWVGTKRPADSVERERLQFASDGMIDRGHFPQHHQPLENMRDEILKNAQPISDLKKENPGDEAAIDRWLEKRGVKTEEVIYQGLKARAQDMAVIMDAKTAKVIGIAPFKPWP